MMSIIINWLGQSAVAAALLAAAGYFGRRVIEARLTASVQHEFDKKLTAFKNELEQEAQRRETVRQTAFSALVSQRSALMTKRIGSAQLLWDGLLEARKATPIVMQLDLLKLDAVVPELSDLRMQRYFELTASGEVMQDEYIMRLHRCASVRPFVSPNAWALYAVYSNIIGAGIGKMQMLKIGQDPRKFLTDRHWSELLPGVLPPEDIQLAGSDAEHGVQWVLSRIEERLLVELQRSMGEASAGLESVADAQRILEACDKLEAAGLEQRLRKGAPAGTLKP